MRWKRGEYIRKRVRIPCPVCEYWLDVTITMRKGKGNDEPEEK